MKNMKLFSAIFIMFFAVTATAQIHSEYITYNDGDAVLEGYIAYDKSFTDKRPGVLVVHEWTGINDYTLQRCKQLAEMGYFAFAADIYGKGIRPSSPEEAGKQASVYKNVRQLMRKRINLALDEIRKQTFVDSENISAIGYCFGGTVVLELARSGADVKGVVSFHGGLDTPDLSDANNIKAKVLALHGADDPYVPEEQVKTFEKEMRDAKVDWQLVSYGNAVHSFTNPGAGNDNSKGAAYNEKADKRSWEAMKNFFDEIFVK